MKYAGATELATRKAAVLAMAYFAGQPEASEARPVLVKALRDAAEDVDVRIAAATVLGPLGFKDPEVLEALRAATRDAEPKDVEVVWSAALSLAQLGDAGAADVILKLLDRNELGQVQVFDREADPKNPLFRKLSDQEQQRILINTMIGAKNLDVPAVQQRLREIAEGDPSARVRAAGRELLATSQSSGAR